MLLWLFVVFVLNKCIRIFFMLLKKKRQKPEFSIFIRPPVSNALEFSNVNTFGWRFCCCCWCCGEMTTDRSFFSYAGFGWSAVCVGRRQTTLRSRSWRILRLLLWVCMFFYFLYKTKFLYKTYEYTQLPRKIKQQQAAKKMKVVRVCVCVRVQNGFKKAQRWKKNNVGHSVENSEIIFC